MAFRYLEGVKIFVANIVTPVIFNNFLCISLFFFFFLKSVDGIVRWHRIRDFAPTSRRVSSRPRRKCIPKLVYLRLCPAPKIA